MLHYLGNKPNDHLQTLFNKLVIVIQNTANVITFDLHSIPPRGDEEFHSVKNIGTEPLQHIAEIQKYFTQLEMLIIREHSNTVVTAGWRCEMLLYLVVRTRQ